MSKHTPGPWVAEEHRDGMDIRPAIGSPADAARIRPCIGYVPKVRFDGAGADCGQSPDEQRANAALIAASPSLLTELIKAVDRLEVAADDAEECGYDQRAENIREDIKTARTLLDSLSDTK